MFEARIREKYEAVNASEVIDMLIGEFPVELQNRLESEIEEMDDQSAQDYLVNKLVARKESLIVWKADSLSEYIEVTHDVPLGILASIEKSKSSGNENILGGGENGEVYESVRRDYACYKVLFPHRVKEVNLNIIREAMMQYECGVLLKNANSEVKIPEVLGFVDHPDVRAIMMDKIKGISLTEFLVSKKDLPSSFDADTFFDALEDAVRKLNQLGYFHRDISNNAGNIMVGDDGTPWIIDFGSMVKAVNVADDCLSYQLKPGGSFLLGNDLSGVQNLKQRVRMEIRNRNA